METNNFSLNYILCRFKKNLQWKFDFPWIWYFVWYTEIFIVFISNFTMLDDTKCYYSRSLILNCLDKMLKLRQFKFLKNSRNWIFDTNWYIMGHVIYLLHCIYYIVSSIKYQVYRHMRKNNKPVRSENLISGQIMFKKGFIRLVSFNRFIRTLYI